MTTERLQEFLVLSQTLNYGKAAKKLYLTQSVLSRHISDLEKEVGVPLLKRDSHHVALTPAGRYFANKAAELDSQYADALSLLSRSDVQAAGEVRIFIAADVLSEQMVACLKQFSAQYPDVHCDLHVLRTNAPDADQLAEADIVFRPMETQSEEKSWECKAAFTDMAYLVLYPGHRFIGGGFALRDFAGETVFMPACGRGDGSYRNNLCLIKYATQNHVNLHRTENAEEAMLFTEMRRGITLLPRHLMRGCFSHLILMPFLSSDIQFDTQIGLNTAQYNPAARLFYNEIDTFRNRSGACAPPPENA